MEPKRWDIDEDAQPYPNQTDGDYYRVDDPAIVLERRIAAWAASNNLLDENGEPRKIIGQASVTADGAIVGHHHATVYYTDRHGKAKRSTLYHRGIAKDCYSTRKAAEAAAKGSTDEH